VTSTDTELALILEAQAAVLQPALEVDDRLRARAAAIFEKEREYLIQAALPAASHPGRELCITENGGASPFGVSVHLIVSLMQMKPLLCFASPRTGP